MIVLRLTYEMNTVISPPLVVLDKESTARSLDFLLLMEAVAQAAAEYEAGTLRSPERMVVPLGQGGVLLSMPAAAPDIAIHKLVNVQPANAGRGLPTIHGVVTVCNAATGQPVCLLDGPEVTGRRTAAVTLLAIRSVLGRAPAEVLMIGTGAQACYHLLALQAVYPHSRVLVRGRDRHTTQAFCDASRILHDGLVPCPTGVPEGVDAVITLTTSTEPVYDEPARADRVIVGVGAFKPDMAEIGKRTLDGSDLYADDPAGARHEAGDLLRAGVDGSRVRSLGTLLRHQPDRDRPVVFKSVGTAAWDLAASRVALRSLSLASAHE
jgi:1-piperideine-2-carboxylate/1-pyrroline-2-carboxylate reductase [NAD(P)H]